MDDKAAGGGTAFPETRWTPILASHSSPDHKRRALTGLLQTYWEPLYVYLWRKGMAPAEAEDAVQGFAVRLLERDFLERLDPQRGRLRSRAWLSGALHRKSHT